MAMLNQVRVNPVEAENPTRFKQFNASGIQRSQKKKALADVKNIIHQKNSQSSTKPNNFVKPNTFGGKNLFNSNTEKNKMTQDNQKKKQLGYVVCAQQFVTVEKENIFANTCKCDEISDYDDKDMLFEDMKLTKSQIEDFALDWENEPVFTLKDKRNLYSDEVFKPIDVDFNYEEDPLEILFETIPEITNHEVYVESPFFEDYNED